MFKLTYNGGDQPYATVGADPEFFLSVGAARAPRKLISAIPLFEGNKNNPERVDVGTVIHDNVSVEFTVPPATTMKMFAENIKRMREKIEDLADSRYIAKQLVQKYGALYGRISVDRGTCAAYWRPEWLSDKEAKTFGCDPDFNAWRGGQVNPKPDARKAGRLRVAGGHVHVGVGGKSERLDNFLLSEEGKIEYIKMLDMTFGQFIARTESTTRGVSKDSCILRRQMYGAAGAYRPKPYGVEYRSPSPFWAMTAFGVAHVWRYVQAVSRMFADDENPETLVKRVMVHYNVSREQIIDSVNYSEPCKELEEFAFSISGDK